MLLWRCKVIHDTDVAATNVLQREAYEELSFGM